MSRETYNTRLRFQVISEVKGRLGFSKVRELSKDLGRSASGVHYQLQKLVSEGLVKKVGSAYVWFAHLRNRSVLNTARKKLGLSKNVDGDGRISNKAQVDRALEEIRSVVGKIPAWFFGIGGPKSCFK